MKDFLIGMEKGFVLALFLYLTLGATECPKIPGPNPTPTPTPSPTPIPLPLPTPVTCTFPQGVPQEDFKIVPNPKEFSLVVDQTIKENTTCVGVTDCTWGPENPQTYLSLMIKKLQEKGLCAGQHENGITDQISVARTCEAGVVWENYQPVNFGGTQHKARFYPGNVKDGWTVPKSCDMNKKPTPPPFDPSCGEPPRPPCPTPTPNCPPATSRIILSVRNQAAWIVDATPQYCNREWCGLNGFPNRNCCPLGPEGNELRATCEGKFSPYTWKFRGEVCDSSPICFTNNNPLQLKIPKSSGTGLVEVCNKDSICGTANVQ